MTTISIVPENTSPPRFVAVAGEKQSFGATAGQALDALTAELGGDHDGAVVVIRPLPPDEYFTAEQQLRMSELLARWREARDGGPPLAAAEQEELDGLIEAEVRGAGLRARALARLIPR